MTLVYLGSYADIGNFNLRRFGQVIDLTDDVAALALAGGVALLPKDVFDSVGFTPQELADYAYPARQANAPLSFWEKKNAAVALAVPLIAKAKAGNLRPWDVAEVVEEKE